MPTPTILLVGLGNPGKQYQKTRHNIGVMLLDAIAEKYAFPAWQKKFEGLFTQATVEGTKLLLLKPQTFMNLSGQSVLPAATFYKLKPAHILVAHDEIDIPFNQLRQKQGGGDAGHNGLKSITQAIGANYHRLRLGVGRPAKIEGYADQVADYVLHPFSADEQPILEKWLADLIANLPTLLPAKA